MLNSPEMAAASDAAIDVAWMTASSALFTEMSPAVLKTPVAACAMDASTSLST